MSISAQHIAAQGGGWEPQRSFSYGVELLGVPGSEVIRLSVLSFITPYGSNQTITVPYMAADRKVAGRATFAGGALTCVDYVDQPVMSSLVEWRKLVYDPLSDKIGLASNYKKQAILTYYDPEGGQPRKWKLEGVWPSAMGGSAPNMGQNGYQQVSITIEYDRSSFQG